MKLTGLSLALALALFSGQAAFAATTPSLPQVESKSYSGSSLQQVFDSWAAAWEPIFKTNFGTGNYAYVTGGDLSAMVFGAQFKTNAKLPGTTTPVYSEGFLYLAGTATYNLPKAVPGPEAGAGIGAAALLGGLYLWRRRQSDRAEA